MLRRTAPRSLHKLVAANFLDDAMVVGINLGNPLAAATDFAFKKGLQLNLAKSGFLTSAGSH